MEVEVQEVDVAAREKVFQEVSSFQGPLDATVVVTLQTPSPEERDEFPEDLRTELMQIFETYGIVVLVRYKYYSHKNIYTPVAWIITSCSCD